MPSPESFAVFCDRQRLRVQKRANQAEARIQQARKASRQGLHDDWEASRPRCIGHAAGQRRANLDEMES